MAIALPVCEAPVRRRRLFDQSKWTGLDYLEVSEDQRSLCVHFFNAIPEGIAPRNVRVEGGRRIRGLVVVSVRVDPSGDPDIDDCLRITLDRAGDFSLYRLCLIDVPDVDPRYACLEFSFKVGCASDLDCKRPHVCPAPAIRTPDIDYLVKDYASFRRLMLDRLAYTMPAWNERHAADIGITLVEVLAFVADYLSYFQDAVATEAYIATARRRVSIKRHARLVDYRMHEGCNARAWVSVTVTSDLPALAPDGFYFTTTLKDLGASLSSAELEPIPREQYEVFEPIACAPVVFRKTHSRIRFHTWGDEECCLPRGSTRATLVDEGLMLKPGDVLILEEGDHRHAVRLTRVWQARDELLEAAIVEVEWCAADALPFALCLSVRTPAPECKWVHDVAVARGNVVLVDHGQTVKEDATPVGTSSTREECACEGSVTEVVVTPDPLSYQLKSGPLTFAQCADCCAPASTLLAQDPRRALPALRGLEGDAEWKPVYDLLSSGPTDRHLVADVDEDGSTVVRAGDGVMGLAPAAATIVTMKYRVGNGTRGNVGANTIRHLVLRQGRISADGIEIGNPIAATGGMEPEPLDEVRLLAPCQFRSRIERAITAEDYANLALRSMGRVETGLQGAAAALRWTGSWYEALVGIDPLHSEQPCDELLASVARKLEQFRRAGHDLRVEAARYVPLDIELTVCVLPHFDRGSVKAALVQRFGRFFDPDNLRFGDDVQLSRIVAAAAEVPGVESAAVTKLKRQHAPADDALDAGVLRLGPLEIARVDSDPNFPENGHIDFVLGGGR